MSVPVRPYHHGDLRDALIDAAVALAREGGGPEAVVVREASRRVGVSHNAAYRHFADRDVLLKAVAGRCMTELARLIERRVAEVAATPGPGETESARLTATGAAYIEFAVSEPGWFRTAFAVPPSLDHLGPGEGVGDSGLNPFELLGARLDALVASGALAPERRPGAEISAWAGVHGLSALLIDGPLRALPQAEREAAIARLLETVAGGL